MAAAAIPRSTKGRIGVLSPVLTAPVVELVLSCELSVSEETEDVFCVPELSAEEDDVTAEEVVDDCADVVVCAAGVDVTVTVPVPYPLSSIFSPTSALLPAIPKGLKECVLNTIVLPSTLGTIVSIAPLSRRCSIV